MANPHVVKLYSKYKDKGFEIVGVSLDKDKAEWAKAIKADELTWPQMSDLKFWQSKGARLYSVNSIPYTVLLDKDGTILEKGLPPDELEKKLAELLEPVENK
jgi:peroxiredoxin